MVANYANLGLLIGLYLELFCNCGNSHSSGCMGKLQRQHVSSFGVAIGCFTRVMQVMSFCAETESVLVLLRYMIEMVPTIIDQATFITP